jgi:hypothetical protein
MVSEKHEKNNPILEISLNCFFGNCEDCEYDHNKECDCLAHK